jgi:hypothetical protein
VLFTFPSRYWFAIGHRGVLRLGGWSPRLQAGLHVSRPTHGPSLALPVRGCHPLWPAFPDRSGYLSSTAGLFRVRSPLLTESLLMSFPPGTEMFQFPGFASPAYGFSRGSSRSWGLPHSDIRGSTIARISPRLFAACHVLHRLSVPRHPPNALLSLLPLQRNGMRREQRGQGGPGSKDPRPPAAPLRKRSAKTHFIPRAPHAPPHHDGEPSCRRPGAQPGSICLFTMSNNRRSASQEARLRANRFLPGPPLPTRAPGRGMVELNGIEPMTSCLQSRRSPN